MVGTSSATSATVRTPTNLSIAGVPFFRRVARMPIILLMATRLRTWLCPTELDRARLLDNSVRIRRARTITTVAIGITLAAFAPIYGWWTVLFFLISAANMGTLDRRIARSAAPQLHIAASIVLIQGILA